MSALWRARLFGREVQQTVQQCLSAAWDFLFPPACLLCGSLPDGESGSFCGDCILALVTETSDVCQRCAAPVGPNLVTTAGCHRCREESFAFRRVLALGVYDNALRSAVLAGKQPHGAPLVSALTDLLLDRQLADLLTEPFDAIVPIPHHWQRRFWQIHAASETVAERLARRLRRSYAPHILRKPRPTPLQATAAPSRRRSQQRGAFAVPPGVQLGGARLLLVDDVLTTGATANAAAKALLAAGASDVVAVVLARGLGRRGQSDAPF